MLLSEDYFTLVFISFYICSPVLRDSSASPHNSHFLPQLFLTALPHSGLRLSKEQTCWPLIKQPPLAADSVPEDGEEGHLAL